MRHYLLILLFLTSCLTLLGQKKVEFYGGLCKNKFYEFTSNISYKWELKKYDFSIFQNSSNWLNSLNFTMTGLNSTAENIIESITQNFSSRNYSFSYTYIDLLISLLMSEIGLSLSY